ncbi:MAG: hypothetical protein AB2L24_08025 [Mangrovibacterium sp.]
MAGFDVTSPGPLVPKHKGTGGSAGLLRTMPTGVPCFDFVIVENLPDRFYDRSMTVYCVLMTMSA